MSDTTNKLLLHICCAPCSIEVIDALREESFVLHGYFFNPNIHPIKEFRARKTTLIDYARTVNLPLSVEHSYGLRDFIRGTYPVLDAPERCKFCYETRLEQTALFAQEHGFEAFTTTLLVSPYQQHDLIARTGERIAKEHGLQFIYRDFRPRFAKGQERARELGLYMQKYCGCVFSEEERYSKKKI